MTKIPLLTMIQFSDGNFFSKIDDDSPPYDSTDTPRVFNPLTWASIVSNRHLIRKMSFWALTLFKLIRTSMCLLTIRYLFPSRFFNVPIGSLYFAAVIAKPDTA